MAGCVLRRGAAAPTEKDQAAFFVGAEFSQIQILVEERTWIEGIGGIGAVLVGVLPCDRTLSWIDGEELPIVP